MPLLAPSLLRLGEAQIRATRIGRGARNAAGDRAVTSWPATRSASAGRTGSCLRARAPPRARVPALPSRASWPAAAATIRARHALNVQSFTSSDIAERLSLSQQAVAGLRALRAGLRPTASTIGKLSLALAELGLDRAWRLGETAALPLHAGARQNGDPARRHDRLEDPLGELERSRRAWPNTMPGRRTRRTADARPRRWSPANWRSRAATPRAAECCFAARCDALQRGWARVRGLVALARARLAQRRPAAARRPARRAAAPRAGLGARRHGPPAGHLVVARAALAANGRDEDAWEALNQAHELLLDGVGNVHDEGLRRGYLNKVEVNREIVRAWLREARRAAAGSESGSPTWRSKQPHRTVQAPRRRRNAAQGLRGAPRCTNSWSRRWPS